MRYKVDFPNFDYEQPRLWIKRSERLFIMSHIPRNEALNVLYVHLIGKVGLWFESYLNGLRGAFNWNHFAEAICRRFGIVVCLLWRNLLFSNKVMELMNSLIDLRGVYCYKTIPT